MIGLSVALPILLFAGTTVIAQTLSPARGEPLLAALPGVTQTPLAGGGVAETAVTEQGGVTTAHLYFYAAPGGPEVAAAEPELTATLGTQVRPLHPVRAGVGHFVVYTVLPPGPWTPHVQDTVGGRAAAFAVQHRVS